jgi:hypothetical protein
MGNTVAGFPQSEHPKYTGPGSHDKHLLPHILLPEAIANLPKVKEGDVDSKFLMGGISKQCGAMFLN